MNRLCVSEQQLSQYMSGQMAAPEAQTVEEHLAGCETCLELARALEGRDSLCRALQAADPSAAASDLSATQLENFKSHVKAALSATVYADSGASETSADAGSSKSRSAPANLDFLAPPQQADEIGRLGPYRIFEVLGTGGMGMVFRAEDVGLKRPVALKVMLPKVASDPIAKERFLREARAAARLEHENVVPIYHVGEERGIPYLAMKLLTGLALDAWLRQQPQGTPPPATMVCIGRAVARGLAAAHELGLIHRDIKPGNLFLERGDPARLRILDFGLARAQEESEGTITAAGAILGTPAYMAPEQARGEHVDQRCDLFSLGCVLYQVATGRMPFQGPNPLSILRALELTEPSPPHVLNPTLPAALSGLIMQLLQKDRDRRPESAVIVEQRLEAIQRDLESPAGHTRRSPRGWWTAVAAALLLTVGLGGVLLLRLDRPDGTLIVETDDPEAQVEVKGDDVTVLKGKSRYEIKLKPGRFSLALVGGNDRLMLDTNDVVIGSADRRTVHVRWQRAGEAKEPALAKKAEAGPSVLDRLDPAAIPASERFGWQPKELVAVLGGHRWRHWGPVVQLAVSPDGQRAASWGLDGVRLWEVRTGTELGFWKGRGVAFSPDRTTLALGEEAGITFLDARTLEKRQTLKTKALPFTITFSADSKTVAAAVDGNIVEVWDVRTGAERFSSPPLPFVGYVHDVLVLAPDGKFFAAATTEGVKLWDVATGKPLPGPAPARLSCVAISPDGGLLAAGTDSPQGHVVRIWNRADGSELATLTGHWYPVSAVAFSADSKTLASGEGGAGGPLRLWDVVKGKEKTRLTGHRGATNCIAFAPDGRTLITGGNSDAAVRLWDVTTGEQLNDVKGYPLEASLLTATPDGRIVAMACSGYGLGRVMAWDVAAGRVLAAWEADEAVSGISISPDGKVLATCSRYGGVQEWDVASAKKLPALADSAERATGITYSPDGTLLAALRSRQEGEKSLVDVRIWDVVTGKVRHTFPAGDASVNPDSLAFSADGARLAVAPFGGRTARLWDLTAGKQRFEVQVPEPEWIGSLSFAGDGKSLLAAGGRSRLTIWDMATGNQQAIYANPHEPDGVTCAVFAPDGSIFSAGDDGRIMQTTGPRQRRVWAQLPGRIHKLALAADGRHLFTANSNGTIYVLRLAAVPATKESAALPPVAKKTEAGPSLFDRLDPAAIPPAERYDWQPKELVGVFGEHRWRCWGPPSLNSVAFDASGDTIVTAGYEGMVRFWDAATGRELHHFPGTRVCVAPDGSTLAAVHNSTQTLKLYDARSRQELATLGNAAEGTFNSLSYSLDGKTLASAGYHDGKVRVWDIATRKERAVYHAFADPPPSHVKVAVSPDGKMVAATSGSKIVVWDADGKEIEHPIKVEIAAFETPLCFSPDGSTLAITGRDGNVYLWAVGKAKELEVLRGHTAMVSAVAFSPDGKRLASTGLDRTVRLWNLATRKMEHIINMDGASVLAFDPQGKRLVTGSEWLRIWDVDSAKELTTLEPAPGAVFSMGFSAHGKSLVTGWNVFDVATGRARPFLGGDAWAVSPVRDSIVARLFGYDLELWDTKDAASPRRIWARPVALKYPGGLVFSPDGATIALLRQEGKEEQATDTVELIDTESAKTKETFTARGKTAPLDTVGSVAFSSDGKRLAFGASQGVVSVVDLATAEVKVFARYPLPVKRLTFSPDGARLAAVPWNEQATIQIWDSATGKEIAAFRNERVGTTTALAFGPDSKTLYSASADRRLLCWRSNLDRDEWLFPGCIHSLLLTPDGRHLLTGNGNGTVYVLRLAPPPQPH